MDDKNEPLSMLDVIDYWKKIAESDYTHLWYKLYNYIDDWAFGIAPDETVTDKDKYHDREIEFLTLQSVLDAMIDLEEQEEIKNAK